MDQQFKTRVTELFGIRHPVLAGGLMWLADARYVAAVVNAGAMGFITARTFPDPGRFREELETARNLTGGKPFGVNLHLDVFGAGNDVVETLTDVAIEEGVRIFETSGLPPRALLDRIRNAAPESVVVHKVASVRHAVSSATKLPIDAVTVVGAECGGHPGLEMVGTMVQVPLAAQAIDIPLIVGGGIGTGSQIAASLAMGADGVLIGTRFLVAEELWSHPAIKARVVEAAPADTRLVMASLRNTFRCLANETAAAVAELEAAGETDFEVYRPFVRGQLQKAAYETGNPELGILSLGQSCVFADRVEPVEAIIDRLLEEAVEAVRVLGRVTSEAPG